MIESIVRKTLYRGHQRSDRPRTLAFSSSGCSLGAVASRLDVTARTMS
jgi:hypothetical protein